MLGAWLEVAKKVEISGDGKGGYTVHVGPWLTALAIVAACSVGAWNSWELRQIRQALDASLAKQAEIQEAVARISNESAQQVPVHERKGG